MSTATRNLGARVVEPLHDVELESMLAGEAECSFDGTRAEFVIVVRGLCDCAHLVCDGHRKGTADMLSYAATWGFSICCPVCDAAENDATKLALDSRPI